MADEESVQQKLLDALPAGAGQNQSSGKHVGEAATDPSASAPERSQDYPYAREPALAPPQQPSPLHQHFDTGLCDCCAGERGLSHCCLAFLCPCIAHGKIVNTASGVGETLPCSVYCTLCTLACFTMGTGIVPFTAFGTLARQKLRRKYGLPARGVDDCLTHFCCHFCAMAQELRHIDAAGDYPDTGAAVIIPGDEPASTQEALNASFFQRTKIAYG